MVMRNGVRLSRKNGLGKPVFAVRYRCVLLDSPRGQKYRHRPAQQDGRMAVGESAEKPAPDPGDTVLDVGKTAWFRVRASNM